MTSQSDFTCDSPNSPLSSPSGSSEMFDPLQSVTSMSVNSQSGDTDSGVHVVEQEGEKDGKHYISLSIYSHVLVLYLLWSFWFLIFYSNVSNDSPVQHWYLLNVKLFCLNFYIYMYVLLFSEPVYEINHIKHDYIEKVNRSSKIQFIIEYLNLLSFESK